MAKLILSFKGRIIHTYELKQGRTLIGREGHCDIPIDSLAIAPLHAQVDLSADRCTIEAMDSAFRLLVNHEIKQACDLSHGDLIHIGKHTLTYTEDAYQFVETPAQAQPDNIEPEPMPNQPEAGDPMMVNDQNENAGGLLQIMNGTNFGRIIPLKGSMTRIGHTGSECAIIVKRTNGYYISLLEGAESPIVNQTPIGDTSIELKNGDIIQVGTTRLQFHAEEAAQSHG